MGVKQVSLLTAFKRRHFTSWVSLMLIASVLAPWQAFADDQLFRQSKEDLTPHPFIQPDLSTGVFTYSRSVTVPPGRNGIQPDIKLTYNSSASRQDSIAGYGWSLNVPYIERLNKNGVDKLFNQDIAHSFFYSSLSGELLQIATTTAVNGSFLGFSLFAPRMPLLHFAQLDPSASSDILPVDTTTTAPDLEMAAPQSSSTDTALVVATTSDALVSSPATDTPDTVAPATTAQPVVFPDEEILTPEASKTAPRLTRDALVRPDGTLAVPYTQTELAGERTPNSKTYSFGLKRDGTPDIRTHFFASPIHYYDQATNALEDIDSRFATTTNGFIVTHAPYQAAIDTSGTKHLITIRHDGMTFAIDPLTASSRSVRAGALKQTGEEIGHTARYTDLLTPGIDLEITALDEQLVKEAVINDPSIATNATGDYLDIPFLLTFNTPVTVSADGRTMSTDTPLVSSSEATLMDSNGVSVRIRPPQAIAAGSATSSEPQVIPIQITYSATSSGLLMVKHVPLAWLRNATLPVRTDATFDFAPYANDGIMALDEGQPPTDDTWANRRGAAAARGVDYTYAGVENGAYIYSGFTSGNWQRMYRAGISFDTSSLDDNAVIASATLAVYSSSLGQNAFSQSVVVDRFKPAASTSLSTTDYSLASHWDGIEQASNRMTVGSWIATSTYQYFALNATGTANISKTASTTFGMRLSGDFDNVAPTWQSSLVADAAWYTSETTGTANDPYLEVILTAAANTPAQLQVESQADPLAVATSNPRFSAIFQTASTAALATSYQIQIATSSTAWTNLYWDSGQQTLSSSTPVNQRSPQIYSTTTFPLTQGKYYWRMKFWDQTGSSTDWSTTGDYFKMQGVVDYGAKVETGDFLRYTHTVDSNDVWVAYDKRGIKYSFGAAASSRISDPSATSSPLAFRWYLDSMIDPNGNSMTYTYATDSNQVYPSKITYTSNGGSGALYEVDFLYENRSDIATSSSAGFQVTTKQRIKEILVYTNGNLTHRYQLTYKSGDNSFRSLLASMQESGWNAIAGTTTLPAVQFGYTTSTNSWTENTATTTKWVLPSPGYHFVGSGGEDNGARVFDLNGDALPDIAYGNANVWLNTGTTWTSSGSYTLPVNPGTASADQGVRFGDVNGDGVVDFVQAISCYPGISCGSTAQNRVYYGGSGGWSLSAQTLPITFVSSNNNGSYNDYGYLLADVNGDGLADITGTGGTYINNGSQWVLDSAWVLPAAITSGNIDNGVRVIDVNGDGLADVVVCNDTACNTGVGATYLNTGHGWQKTTNFWMPISLSPDRGLRFIDVNGDGLPDLSDNNGNVYFNSGSGWSSATSSFPVAPVYIPGTGYIYDRGVVIDDFNGDGLPDVLQSRDGFLDCNCTNPVRHVWLKDGVKADLLTVINNEKGGATTIAYGRTTLLAADGTQSNPSPSIPIDVVNTVATNPGFGGKIATTTYTYKGGVYYYASKDDRQFAGFASSTQTNDLGHSVRSYFHQGNSSDSSNGEYNDHVSKIGRPYRVEDLDGTTSAANLYSRTINKWARADYGDGRNFVKLVQWVKQVFDGDSSHRDTAASTTYNDANGNVLISDNWGEVTGNSDGTFTDVGSDAATTTYSYAASSTLSTMSLPSRELMNDQSGSTVKDTKWYYDSLSLGSVSKGNQTKEERLVSGSSYASTTKTYDTYGNVLVFTDPRGGTTTNVYDQYNLYPATTTNALNQSLKFQYDYSSGRVATSTDENARVLVTKYDGLNRATEEDQPDFLTPTTLVAKTTYTYTDSTSSPSSVLRKDYVNSATTSDLYTYFDGLGRTIQTKREAEATNGYVTSDTIYNNIGSVGSQSLPYFNASSANTSPTTTSYLFTNFTYDSEGRVLTIADSVGTTTNTYADWKLTITDPLGNKKDLIKDAWGNLAQVVEYLSPSSSATTTYGWNLLGKLTKLTDSLANVRNFSYDSLGRILTSEDLHAVGDTTFGTTTSTYDNAGNVTTLLNPRNQTINYTYDALNRTLTEDYTGQSGTEIISTYDSPCTNGIGRLCQVVKLGAGTTTYSYNPIGLTATTAIKVSSTWATTTTSYHRNGAVDTVTYPNSQKIWNIYNNAGDLNKVLSEAPASTTWRKVIESTNYGPNGLPTFIDYGNNTQTTNTYDATKKYRLIHKVTVSTSTTLGVPESLSL